MRGGPSCGPAGSGSVPVCPHQSHGVIPKGSTGKWRLIVDLSAPDGASVNDGIDTPLGSLTYVRVQDAAEGVLSFGRDSLLAKVDVRSAYRNVPVHPEDRWMLGMLGEGGLYVDKTLSFGLHSAPKIFTALADAVEWVTRQEGVRFVIHYLDDFLVIGQPDSPECARALSKLLEILERLGLPVAPEKVEGPLVCLGFLGFEVDSRAMEIRLPRSKLEEIVAMLKQWEGSSRKDLQSLVGKLSFAARVVTPGRTFMGRLFQLLRGAQRAHHRVRLSRSFQSDIRWWLTFMEEWNGVSMIRPPSGGQQPTHIGRTRRATSGVGHYNQRAGHGSS